jgi:hypothetical protein
MPGNNMNIHIELKLCPFVKAVNTLGKHIGSVIKYDPGSGDQVYAPGLHSIYEGEYDGDFDGVTENISFDSSYTINSITEGYNFPLSSILYINTNNGIITYDGDTSFNYNFSQNLNGPVSVLKSCAFTDAPNAALYFMRDGGFGGVYLDADGSANWDWIDVDLSGYLLGQPALDLTASLNYAYFVTKFGAFRLSEELVKNYDSPTADANYSSLAEFFKITDNGKYIDIRCLSYLVSADLILIGTVNGIWHTTVNNTGSIVFLIPPESYELTEGHIIEHIKVYPNYIIASTPTYLYIIRRLPAFGIKRIPFIAGIPGSITGLEGWDTDILLISGSEGLVALDLNSNPFTFEEL